MNFRNPETLEKRWLMKIEEKEKKKREKMYLKIFSFSHCWFQGGDFKSRESLLGPINESSNVAHFSMRINKIVFLIFFF